MDSEKWVRVLGVADIGDGEVVGVEVDGASIAIYRVDGVFYATANICTHALAYLSEGWLEGHTIECPLHGGQFDVRTGSGLGAPITEDLQVYPVKLEDDGVYLRLDA